MKNSAVVLKATIAAESDHSIWRKSARAGRGMSPSRLSRGLQSLESRGNSEDADATAEPLQELFLKSSRFRTEAS